MLSTISKKLGQYLAKPTSIKVLHPCEPTVLVVGNDDLLLCLRSVVCRVPACVLLGLFYKRSNLGLIPELLNQNQTFNKIPGLRTSVLASVGMLDSESSFLFLIFICNYIWHSIDSLFYSCIYATISDIFRDIFLFSSNGL